MYRRFLLGAASLLTAMASAPKYWLLAVPRTDSSNPTITSLGRVAVARVNLPLFSARGTVGHFVMANSSTFFANGTNWQANTTQVL